MSSLTPSTQSTARWLASPQARIDIDRERCKRSLVNFIRAGWHVLEPTMPLTMGWAIEAICEHLEAVSNGELNRLVMNVPPGMMKSLATMVFWPAWEWGPKGFADMRFMGASYEQELAIRDARKMRLLVESDWYQERWPLKMAGDQNQKTKFENVKTGVRLARSAGSLTGERVHRLGIDDPHSVKTAESDVERASTLLTFREAAQNRMVDPAKSAIIVIMQRLHHEDISGWLIDNAPDYEKLILPMEFEPERRCTTRIGFTDPRTEDGELLFPERFPKEVLDRDRKIMGAYAWAGQYQQRPTPREGGLFKPDNIEIVETLPAYRIEWVRAWDFGGTAGAGAFSAGVLLGRYFTGARHPVTRKLVPSYIIGHVMRAQKSPHQVQLMVQDTAISDGKQVRIRIPQDPGQSGKGQVLDYAVLLDGYALKWKPVTGDKEQRALPVATQVEAGQVKMLKGEWNDALIAEMRMFPAGKYKDQVDALSDAYTELLELPNEGTLHAPVLVPLA